MKQIKAASGQTLIDIAIQEYGCYDGVFILMEDNNVGLGADVLPGATLVIRDEVPELTEDNVLVANRFKAQKRLINSGFMPNTDDYNDNDFNEDFN